MKWEEVNSIYFVGIGGIGMSAIARYFNLQGKSVFGYDRTRTPLIDSLMSEGIDVAFEDEVTQIPNHIDFVVFTPAIPNSNKILSFFKNANFPMFKRSQVLGLLTEHNNGLAIAGTHGKTSTSAMLAHVMNQTGKGVNAFIGGVLTNYNSNLIQSSQSDVVVVEADEFDRSFMTLHPQIAAITSMDADHLDIYGEADQLKQSFSDFATQVKETLILKNGLTLRHSVPANVLSYGVETQTDYSAEEIEIKNGFYEFDVSYPGGKIEDVTLGLPGRHNVENAVAAFAVAHQYGLEAKVIKEGLKSFDGVKRRFETHIKTDQLVYIDDYAHHPTELEATINSAKELYEGKPIKVVFQPHLFSRTRDFENDFAEALSLADELILLDIYPAREMPIEGVTSEILLDKVKLQKKKLLPKSDVIEEVMKNATGVWMTLGAGDIDQLIEPLKKAMS